MIKRLQEATDKILHSDNHKWYVNKMDPEEAAMRKQRQEEFTQIMQLKVRLGVDFWL